MTRSKRKTDFRRLKAMREAALARPELRHRREPATPEVRRLIDDAVAAGQVTRVPEKQRRRPT